MVTFLVLAVLTWAWVGYHIHKAPIIDPKHFFDDEDNIKRDEYGNPTLKD